MPTPARQMLNKVPEITLYFWIIKILCTTVGETVADYLNTTLGFGLNGTSVVMGVLLILALTYQFWTRKYTAWIYWLAVVLISVVGTLITDNLTDNLGVSLTTTTIVFALALGAVFALWYAVEKTLSIHSIISSRREAFYWLTILCTFALGTAAGDLVAEKFSLGYLVSIFIFVGCIGCVVAVHYSLQKVYAAVPDLQASVAVATFWAAYILTRPLGASIGDYLSQATGDGGLGLGTTTTSFIFLGAILSTVVYLIRTKKDVTPAAVEA